jgi:hypothetical protein
MQNLPRLTLKFVLGLLPFASSASFADEWRLSSPVPRQVVQREGYIPAQAHEHQPGGPALGHGLVPLAGGWPNGGKAALEFRVVKRPDATGRDIDWTPLETKCEGARR